MSPNDEIEKSVGNETEAVPEFSRARVAIADASVRIYNQIEDFAFDLDPKDRVLLEQATDYVRFSILPRLDEAQIRNVYAFPQAAPIIYTEIVRRLGETAISQEQLEKILEACGLALILHVKKAVPDAARARVKERLGESE